MPADPDLAALLGRVALRDRAALAALYAATGARVHGICLRILKDRAEAEDAVQDIYVKIWAVAGRFAGSVHSPRGWINSVARNHAIDRLRARKPGGGALDAAERLPDPGPTPEEAALIASDGRRIAACLEALPPPRAEAVRRAFVEGDSYLELADRFAVPLNTMRSWLRRSLLQLRACLDD